MTPDEKAQRETRLPYEPPAVISEEVFETLALGCAKTGDTPSCTTPPLPPTGSS